MKQGVMGLREKLESGKEYYEIRLESIGGLGANLCGKMLGEMGATEKHSTSTMQTMGKTACRDSVNFSLSFSRVAFNGAIHPFNLIL